MPSNTQKLSEADHAVSFVAPGEIRLVHEKTLYERSLKRPLDVAGALVLLTLTLPLSLIIALAIRVGLGRGIFYRQQRVGLDGAPFTILKFRTMRPDRRTGEIGQTGEIPVEQDRRSEHKVDNDPRHTGLGRLLRRVSLDELPQLINVLRGQMSLVGPRPEVVGIASQRGYLHHARHEVRPGMTGPYQVSDLRLNGDLRDGLELDAEYVRNLTFATDLRCILKTFGVMLGHSSGS